MDFKTIILIFALLPNALLGFLSYYKGKKNKTSFTWTILVWTIILWIVAMIVYRSSDYQTSVFWCKVLYVAASLIPITFLYFSFLFPENKWSIRKRIRILLFLPAIVVIALVIYPNAIIKDILIKPGQEKIIVFGYFYSVYALYFSVFFSWSLWNIFKKYLKAEGIIKRQLFYIFWGTGISSAFGIIFNLYLPWVGRFELNWLGQVTTLIMILFISYAISRYRFMDIKIILTEILVYIIGFVLLIEVFLSESLFRIFFRGGIFVFFGLAGYLLIKSVLKEIQRREEVERLDKAKSEFLSIASHQLRTPLTAIKGYISMMLEGTYGKPEEKIKKILKNVYESNERLIGLINDLLNVSRLEAGKIKLEIERISAAEIVSEVVEELKMSAKNKNIYLKRELPKKIPEIMADKRKIRQVILNIIDNAIKYTDKGGVIVEIKGGKDLFPRQKNKIQIIIKDTGEGMNKEEINNIFQIFSRGKAGNKLWTEGTGLGLYVARKFVEMHRGRIWAESNKEKGGSAFYIELPVK